MKILAKAFPNKKYFGIRSIRDLVLEARLRNNKVEFFETHSDNKNWIVPLREELVNAMFPLEVSTFEKPFLPDENKDFWTVLNRTNEIGFHKFCLLKNKK